MRQTSLLIQQPWERLDWWEVDRRTALWAVEETARGHIFARRCFTVWLYLPGLTGGQAVGWRGPRRIINTTSARDSICPWGRMDNISCFEAKTGKIRNGWFMSSSFLFFFPIGISEYNFQVLGVTCSAQWTHKGELERNRIRCFPSSSSSPS